MEKNDTSWATITSTTLLFYLLLLMIVIRPRMVCFIN